jgi:hypothetical protein
MPTLKLLGQGAAILSALVALISLAITAHGLLNDLDKQRILEWQEVVAFSLVREAGTEGIAFEPLESKFVQKEHDLPNALPRGATQSDALQRVLLSLMAKHAITIQQDGKFAILFDLLTPDQIRMTAVVERLQPVSDAIISITSQRPGELRWTDLKTQLEGVFKFSDQEFWRLVSSMEAQALVHLDKSAHVWPGPPAGPEAAGPSQPSKNK